jgi:hypothetical protein
MKHSLPEATRTSTRTKALVTGGLVALTVAGVGGAAFASFTGTTSATQSVSAGTLSLSAINGGGAGNRLTVPATDVAPGDTIQRAVTITTTGTVAITGMELTTTATDSSLLDSDATDGLQMVVDSCSVPWTESSVPYTYTCVGGTTQLVLAETSVIGAERALGNIDTDAGATNHLRVTLTLPDTADDDFQAEASTLVYQFDATQRAGVDK